MEKPPSKIHFSENSSFKEARNEVTHHQSISPSRISSPPSAPSVGNPTVSARLPESQLTSFSKKAAASSPSTSLAPQARKGQRPASQNLSSSSAPESHSTRCELMSGSIGKTKSSNSFTASPITSPHLKTHKNKAVPWGTACISDDWYELYRLRLMKQPSPASPRSADEGSGTEVTSMDATLIVVSSAVAPWLNFCAVA